MVTHTAQALRARVGAGTVSQRSSAAAHRSRARAADLVWRALQGGAGVVARGGGMAWREVCGARARVCGARPASRLARTSGPPTGVALLLRTRLSGGERPPRRDDAAQEPRLGRAHLEGARGRRQLDEGREGEGAQVGGGPPRLERALHLRRLLGVGRCT